MSEQQQQEHHTRGEEGAQRRAESQRRVNVQREIERMKHVITKLASQEARAAKRAQIIEMRAREVEGVRHESEREYKVRESLMMEKADQRVRQQQKVQAIREERKQRAESTRRDLRSHKMEMAKMTKEQQKLITDTLCETNAAHHDRCVQQHAIIRASEKESNTARRRTEQKKREEITLANQQRANETMQQQDMLRILAQQAREMEQRVQNSKTVEDAAGQRLRSLCLTNKVHQGRGSVSPNDNSSSTASPNARQQGRDDDSGDDS